MPKLLRYLVVAGLSVAGTVMAPTASAAPRASLTLGAVALHRCDLGTSRPAWCGSVRVPLDPAEPAGAAIAIGFGWLPSAGRAHGTVVAQEGGPGYPSTGTAADYEAMYGPLLTHRNMLVVDARGTGRSAPIDCEPLQALPPHSPRFLAAVAACGQQLNHTYRRSDGSFVHASDLFSTANSARDMAQVLTALQLTQVDLYGDSYGTYFAQSFLARYPQFLRSVVLDSAYEARDLDPWYRTTVTTARSAFDAVCARAAGCPAGSSWARIGRLAATLRRHPVTGRVVGTDAALHRVTVGVTALVDIVNDAGYDFEPYRQLDAAARAYLEHRDVTPLLRLYAQDIGYDYSDYNAPATYYSDGLYMAVACTDYPQLFDLRSPPARRRAELAASIATLPVRTFAPFTTREWLTVLPYTETYTGCLTWPRPTHRADPPVPVGAAMNPGHVPVLVLNGELDSLTPAVGGAHVARQIGPDARAFVAANTVHLVALASAYDCGPSLVRAFVRDPRAALATGCLARLPAVRAVAEYAGTLEQVTPADGHAPLTVLRLAAVALSEAGDSRYRFDYVDGSRDLGLRGGSVRYDRAGDATLRSVRWTTDTTVSGVVRRTPTGGRGSLVVRAGSAPAIRVGVRWGPGPRAMLVADGVSLTAPAP